MLNLSFDFWDILLISVVAVQATVLAYVYHPKWKAFLLTLPFPFTVAVLAVGKPINFTNMLGLLLLVLFSHGVRIFYHIHKINIIISIILSAAGYCLIGGTMRILLPDNDITFWFSTLAVIICAVMLIRFFPQKVEPGYRSSLPIFVKVVIIIAVVLILIIIKKGLGGFMTVFPMVGVIAAYESRNSLWTMSRQMPIVLLTLGSMIAVIFILQNVTGIYWALAIGWGVFILVLIPCTKHSLKERRDPGQASA